MASAPPSLSPTESDSDSDSYPGQWNSRLPSMRGQVTRGNRVDIDIDVDVDVDALSVSLQAVAQSLI